MSLFGKRLMALSALALATGFVSPAFSSGFSAGASSQSLEVPQDGSLAGYFERHLPLMSFRRSPHAHFFKKATGQNDPLRVKALVIKQGDRKIALVSVDLVAVFPGLGKYLAQELAAHGYLAHDVIVTATHTHSSFGGYVRQPFWEYMAVDRWVPRLTESIQNKSLETVLAAEKNLQTANISVGSHDVTGMVMNRRGSPDLDPTMNLIQFLGQDGAPIASLINMAVHGNLLPPENLRFSSDVPGELERRLEKKTGGVAIFVSGAAGDVDPQAASRDFAGLTKYGQDFESRLPRFLSQQTKATQPQILETARFSQNLDRPVLNYRACITTPALPKWLPRLLRLPNMFAIPSDLVALRLGRYVFVFVPGEPFVKIGRAVREAFQREDNDGVFIIGLANSYQGYIMDEDEYRKGGYEGCNSFYGSTYGGKILEGIDKLLGVLWPVPQN